MSIDYIRRPLQFKAMGQDTDGKRYSLGNFKIDIDMAKLSNGLTRQVYVLKSEDGLMQDISITERQFDVISKIVGIRIEHNFTEK